MLLPCVSLPKYLLKPIIMWRNLSVEGPESVLAVGFLERAGEMLQWGNTTSQYSGKLPRKWHSLCWYHWENWSWHGILEDPPIFDGGSIIRPSPPFHPGGCLGEFLGEEEISQGFPPQVSYIWGQSREQDPGRCHYSSWRNSDDDREGDNDETQMKGEYFFVKRDLIE